MLTPRQKRLLREIERGRSAQVRRVGLYVILIIALSGFLAYGNAKKNQRLYIEGLSSLVYVNPSAYTTSNKADVVTALQTSNRNYLELLDRFIGLAINSVVYSFLGIFLIMLLALRDQITLEEIMIQLKKSQSSK